MLLLLLLLLLLLPLLLPLLLLLLRLILLRATLFVPSCPTRVCVEIVDFYTPSHLSHRKIPSVEAVHRFGENSTAREKEKLDRVNWTRSSYPQSIFWGAPHPRARGKC